MKLKELSFERIGYIKAQLQLFDDHVFLMAEDCMPVKLCREKYDEEEAIQLAIQEFEKLNNVILKSID
ncbi:hypothetical protein Q8G35_12395 [Peribacillus simplex]|uniref:Uncharacterized protein n=2 Tax=Peribacillus TaxID=2675229 RepID=A0AA90PCW5_9BACI|nr:MULTISPECIES: hypothetical protein [Peribacillus]MDP1419211.1 hypothetical protein [Peribacillus simplex]MDP1452151.1 hypothetical protein [Peribacillus frigoritolerans]